MQEGSGLNGHAVRQPITYKMFYLKYRRKTQTVSSEDVNKCGFCGLLLKLKFKKEVGLRKRMII